MHDAAQTQRPTTSAAEELLGLYFPVLDHGFVSLVDYMGGDEDVARAARVSYGQGAAKRSATRGLLRYMYRHRHTSPFEMVELKFHCRMPIFVARQWIRHRTASVNEVSGRYSVLPAVFYMPPDSELRAQSNTNKQGRGEGTLEVTLRNEACAGWDHSRKVAADHYHWLVEHDFARELARIDLPLSTYTEWYWKIDVHNLLHFLTLRIDPHAQWEIRQYAEVMVGMIKRVVPLTYEAWVDYDLCGARLSRAELELLRRIVRRAQGGDLGCSSPGAPCVSREDAALAGMVVREVDEFWGLFDDGDAPREVGLAPDHELDLKEARPASYFEAQVSATRE